MPSFQYQAKQKDAKSVSGQIIAADKEDAVEKIHQLGLIPVKVEEMRFEKGMFGRRIKPKVLYTFSRQMTNLLKGGVSILHALELMAAQEKDPYFKNIIQSLHLGIQQGNSLSDALAQYPFVFPSLYAAMVRVGEESGRLKEIFADLAQYLHKQEEIRSKVSHALIYPMMMAVLGMGSVIFILTYVLPKLMVLYKQFEQSLPLPTLIVMNTSRFLMNNWLWLALIFVILFGAFKRWSKKPQAQLKLSDMALRLPVVGMFLQKVDMMRFCKTLELLLHSGVGLVRALPFSISVMHNELLKKEFNKIHVSLEAGHSLAEAIKETAVFPPMMGSIISVGEESGNITEALYNVSENYEEETEENIKFLTTLLEPLLIVAIGAVLGFIVIAMLLPIFQLDMLAA